MGYTHYWKSSKPFTQKAWDELTTMLREAARTSDIPLAYEFDEPQLEPQLDTDTIRFNGVGVDGLETFLLLRDHVSSFDFCKTNRKPYDVFVVATLICATALNGSFSWSSDGRDDDHDDGIRLAARMLEMDEATLRATPWLATEPETV